MKQLIIGLTVGAIAGAIAYKKMDDNKVQIGRAHV